MGCTSLVIYEMTEGFELFENSTFPTLEILKAETNIAKKGMEERFGNEL